MKEIEIVEGTNPNLSPEALPNWMDMIKYGAIISEVINTLKSLTSLALNAVVKLQTLKVRLGSSEWEWDMGSITKKK